MPFGILSVSKIMQKHNDETFSDISGVYVIADDTIVVAANECGHMMPHCVASGNKEKVQ